MLYWFDEIPSWYHYHNKDGNVEFYLDSRFMRLVTIRFIV